MFAIAVFNFGYVYYYDVSGLLTTFLFCQLLLLGGQVKEALNELEKFSHN